MGFIGHALSARRWAPHSATVQQQRRAGQQVIDSDPASGASLLEVILVLEPPNKRVTARALEAGTAARRRRRGHVARAAAAAGLALLLGACQCCLGSDAGDGSRGGALQASLHHLGRGARKRDGENCGQLWATGCKRRQVCSPLLLRSPSPLILTELNASPAPPHPAPPLTMERKVLSRRPMREGTASNSLTSPPSITSTCTVGGWGVGSSFCPLSQATYSATGDSHDCQMATITNSGSIPAALNQRPTHASLLPHQHTLLESRMVLMRCAMVSTVQCLNSRRIVRWISESAAGVGRAGGAGWAASAGRAVMGSGDSLHGRCAAQQSTPRMQKHAPNSTTPTAASAPSTHLSHCPPRRLPRRPPAHGAGAAARGPRTAAGAGPR